MLEVINSRVLVGFLCLVAFCILCFSFETDVMIILLSVLWRLHAPLPFGRICFVVLVMRKGGESI